MNKWLKDSLKELEPYRVNEVKYGIKLDANESPYTVPTVVKEKMKEWLEQVSLQRYPDSNSTRLREEIAKCYKVSIQEVTCGVGSDQLIDCILRGTLEKGDKVLMPYPSFSMYKIDTLINAGICLPIPLTRDLEYDTEEIISTIEQSNPKVVFICNPNNPTGTSIKVKDIKRIVESTKGLVVVDEAYMEFTKETMIPFIREYSNLIILRTFSKAYALAGVRVGYAIGNQEIIEMIDCIKPPYSLNVFSEEIALWSLKYKDLLKPYIEETLRQRDYLKSELLGLGYKVYPSEANFIFIETDYPLDKWLEANQIYIRKIYFNHQNYYRLTVGLKKENDYIIEVLRRESA